MDHPSIMIEEASLRAIRKDAFRAEHEEQLTSEVLERIYDNRWLRVLMPESCGGLEWPLPDVVSLFESLARADANVGWCVNLGAGANMFAGYLKREVAGRIFNSEITWCAGSGAITGQARKCAGGYLISGHWKYASGAAHATHFTANCMLQDTIQDRKGESGFRSFIFPAEEARVHKTWKTSGLRATSSHNFEVSEIFVPEEHVFSLALPSVHASGPLYGFPFGVLAVVNMACMPTGIALHFIDLFQELVNKKKPLQSAIPLVQHSGVQTLFRVAAGRFYRARAEMFAALHAAWEPFVHRSELNKARLLRLVSASRNAAAMARNLVHELFPVCGMDILYSDAELNKVWRDMAAAAQHYLLSPMYQPDAESISN